MLAVTPLWTWNEIIIYFYNKREIGFVNVRLSLKGPCFYSSGVRMDTRVVTVKWGSLELLLRGQVT